MCLNVGTVVLVAHMDLENSSIHEICTRFVITLLLDI
jgi:hypothetical protein